MGSCYRVAISSPCPRNCGRRRDHKNEAAEMTNHAGDGADYRNPAAKTWLQLKEFWKIRGGWSDLIRSPYSLVSLGLMVPTFHLWLFTPWWELSASILPNLLGFSLGGYAIMLAFGDDRFKALLARKSKLANASSEEPSLYLKSSAIFLHFILVQLMALVAAIVA